jgi:hypothetical protein
MFNTPNKRNPLYIFKHPHQSETLYNPFQFKVPFHLMFSVMFQYLCSISPIQAFLQCGVLMYLALEDKITNKDSTVFTPLLQLMPQKIQNVIYIKLICLHQNAVSRESTGLTLAVTTINFLFRILCILITQWKVPK